MKEDDKKKKKIKIVPNDYETQNLKFGITAWLQKDTISFSISNIGNGIIQIKELFLELEYYFFPHDIMGPSYNGAVSNPFNYEIYLTPKQKLYHLLPLTPDNTATEWQYINNDMDVFKVECYYPIGTIFAVRIKANIYDYSKKQNVLIQSKIQFLGKRHYGSNSIKEVDKIKPGNLKIACSPLIYKIIIIRRYDYKEFLSKINKELIHEFKDQIFKLLEVKIWRMQQKILDIISYFKLKEALPYLLKIFLNENCGRNTHYVISTVAKIGGKDAIKIFHEIIEKIDDDGNISEYKEHIDRESKRLNIIRQSLTKDEKFRISQKYNELVIDKLKCVMDKNKLFEGMEIVAPYDMYQDPNWNIGKRIFLKSGHYGWRFILSIKLRFNAYKESNRFLCIRFNEEKYEHIICKTRCGLSKKELSKALNKLFPEIS